MFCLRCEVIRAKLIANGLAIVGKPLPEIVEKLNAYFGGKYFLDGNKIVRSNSPVNFVIYQGT